MKVIKCPHCKLNQLFEQFEDGGIWFPVSPFCCEIMRNADGPDWNRLLDLALATTFKLRGYNRLEVVH